MHVVHVVELLDRERSCCSAMVRCEEEDETVVAGKFASDKGGGCHGDGKR